MKKYALNDITLMQFIFMIHGAQLGVGVLTLPADLAKIAGTDGWISLFLGWAITLIVSVVIIQIMKHHPEDTLYDLLPRYFGKWLGLLLNLLVVGYFLLAFFSSTFGALSVVKQTLLPKTPNYLLALVVCIPIYTIAKNHLRIIARYAELTFWGCLWLLPLFMYALKESVWLNLLPMIKEGWMPILKGGKATTLSFQGFETLFILYPFLKHKNKALKGVFIANSLTLFIYVLAVLVCFLYFPPDGITHYNWPPLRLLKTLEFRFLERFEVIWIVGYLFILSRIWIFTLYYASLGSSRIFGKQDHRPYVRIYVLGLLMASFFYAPGYSNGQKFQEWSGNAGIVFAFIFPWFLWLYTTLFRRLRKGASI